ncbi:hypothetical protein TNCV_1487821 [Trichonephila clavipes]|nr:hypothetical protein TNCV_1487821 [Trichonephila clavipes]
MSQIGKVVFSDESRFVLGTDDNRVQGQFSSKIMLVRIQQELRRLSTSFSDCFHGRPAPRFVACRAQWDQLKRQMPSCHSVHDLELAVQDL